MATRVLTVSAEQPDPGAIAEAARVLESGGVIGMPTETVYGLAARRDHPGAISRLRALKGRPPEAPLPVQIADPAALPELVACVPLRAKPLMRHFWPGPLTIVFSGARVSAGGEGIGVRVPAHAVARAVLRRLGRPAAVPSLNPRGAAPAVDGTAALAYFPDQVDLILDAGPTPIREASTVVRVEDGSWELLREGLISREMVSRLIEGRCYLFVCTGNTCRSPMACALAEDLCAELLGLTAAELESIGFRFVSAGTEAEAGRPASPNARAVLAEEGLNLDHHRARRLSDGIIRRADTIMCMESEHRAAVRSLVPEAAGKTQLLAHAEVADPAGGDVDAYRSARDTIRGALRQVWPGNVTSSKAAGSRRRSRRT